MTNQLKATFFFGLLIILFIFYFLYQVGSLTIKGVFGIFGEEKTTYIMLHVLLLTKKQSNPCR